MPRTYPAATQKGVHVADLCLYQLQCNVQMHVRTSIKESLAM